MSGARSSRVSRRNTDFSIARILAVEDREQRRQDARQRTRKQQQQRRRHDPVVREERTVEEETEETRGVERTAEYVERIGGTRERNVSADRRGNNDGNDDARTDLTWLQYTRYRPPRLPRRTFAERRVKRRTGEQPRIPFSASQLQVLEDRYRRGAYLSRSDVVEVSATLRLPQSKVKIWFQNRRARQRRELLSSIVTAR